MSSKTAQKKAVARKDMSRTQWTWKEMKRNWVAYVMVAPFMLIFSCFTILPVVLSIFMSFTDFNLLQMPNIVKNPRIWIPPTVASAITGPLATCVFGMKMYGAAINSGMGTCGLLGPIGIIIGWYGGEYTSSVTAFDYIGLILICFVLPAVISVALCELLRKIGWIKENDLKLD